jgi:glucose-6-phosphate 1-epimerase
MAMTNEAIAAILAASSSATLDESRADYPLIRVANAHGEAVVALHGAHLLDYRSVGDQPLLYLSPTARFREGTAVRGGVPVCWPWFGAHPTNPAMPFHGFARDRFWVFEGVSEADENVTELAFRLPPRRTPEGLWSRDFELIYNICVSSALDLELTTRNTGSEPLAVGGALHTYLAVSALSDVCIEGLEGHEYLDATRGRSRHRQEGPVRFDEAVNRIYLNTGPISTLRDPGWNRLVQIDAKGSRTTVVWNPWVEQSRGFKDLPDDGYHRFVCIETANAEDDVHTLQPGEEHTLACRISTGPLEEDASEAGA